MSNYVTKDQYNLACAVDLSLWLLEHHPDDVALQYGSVLLLADTHISVKVGYHGYINFQTGATGNNVDYLMYFLGYTFPEAVLALLDQNSGTDTDDIDHQAHHKFYTAEDKPTILHYMVSSLEYSFPQALTSLTDENLNKILTYLNEYGVSLESAIYYICGLPRHDSEIKSAQISCPPKGNTNKNLFAYLQSRSIPAHIIRNLLDMGILYQDGHRNVVFITPQKDYCEIRGTNTYADTRCKQRGKCPDYHPGEHDWCTWMNDCSSYRKDSFHGCRRASPNRFWYFSNHPESSAPASAIYVCEAAIDAISLFVIHWQHGITAPAIYASIGGVSNQQAIDRLKKHDGVVIATDRDEAGNSCRERNSELASIVPVYKDWNEDLQKGAFYEYEE